MHFRQQQYVKVKDELAEVLFLFPVTSSTRAGLQWPCLTSWFPGAHGCYFYMISLYHKARGGEGMLKREHYFVTDFVHAKLQPLFMYIGATQLTLVILHPSRISSFTS